jgi:uncharacterized protein YhbP (UPF0306 family)
MSDDQGRLAENARAIVDAQLFMVLGTADRAGEPWASPVYYAHANYRELFWVSPPDATHSRNIEVRPELAVVIFDSSVPINAGQGVYMSALAKQLGPEECAEGLRVFSERSLAHGGAKWTLDDVMPPARHRLYRATAMRQYVLDEHDNRVPVSIPL